MEPGNNYSSAEPLRASGKSNLTRRMLPAYVNITLLGLALGSVIPPSIVSIPVARLQLSSVRTKMESLYEETSIEAVLDHIVEWPLVQTFESALRRIQVESGLSWWATIATTTIALRVLTLPWSIFLVRHQLRSKLVGSEQITKHLAMCSGSGNSDVSKAHASAILRLFRRQRANPFAMIAYPITTPFFLSYFAAKNNLSLYEPALATGGFAFFPDLCAVDSSNVLPVVAALSWLAVVESNAGQLYVQSGRLKLVTRFTCLASIQLMSTLPNAIFMFWIPSNLFETLRIIAFNSDRVRRIFRIPLRSQLPAVRSEPM